MAIEYPDRLALFDDRHAVSYGKLDILIDLAISNLRTKGVEEGNVVGILGQNSIAYAVMLFAAWRMGFVLMPLNCRLSPEDWNRQVATAGCRLLVLDVDYLPYGDRIGVNAVALNEIVTGADMTSLQNLDEELPLGREALIIFSSGTTDTPRGMVLTWANLYYSAQGAASVLAYRPEDIWLAALPFFHIGGISIPFRTALTGCAACVVDRFDPARAIEIISEHRISFISVVSTMLTDLIHADRENKLTGCRGIILGGAAWDESLLEEITARQLPVLTTYGLTETSSMVTLLPPDSPFEKLATSGKALPHREIMIIDDDGRERPRGEIGHIAVRGKTLLARYLNQDRPPYPQDGWFITDDIGKIDEEGYLTVIGRADSVIVSGGENIDLNRVEREFQRLPGVAGAVVLSRPDRRWGSRPVAFVEAGEKGIDEVTLQLEIAERLPKIMIPDRIIVLDRLPRTGSGKHDRSALRRDYTNILGENNQS
jgi:O-succinylbenzoic acid--CoA ligase